MFVNALAVTPEAVGVDTLLFTQALGHFSDRKIRSLREKHARADLDPIQEVVKIKKNGGEGIVQFVNDPDFGAELPYVAVFLMSDGFSTETLVKRSKECGVSLVERMSPSGSDNLRYAWLNCDVTHSKAKGWKMFGAYVYSTEAHRLLTVALMYALYENKDLWQYFFRKLKDVCKKSTGVEQVNFQGFVADAASTLQCFKCLRFLALYTRLL